MNRLSIWLRLMAGVAVATGLFVLYGCNADTPSASDNKQRARDEAGNLEQAQPDRAKTEALPDDQDNGPETEAVRAAKPLPFEGVYPIDDVFPGRESFPEGNAELQRLYERFSTKQSWHFEEWFVRDYFNDMREGFFVDVGAFHYKNSSNTYALETSFGWSGIAVDAQEKFREGYEKNRPRTRFFSYYVSDRSTGEKDFLVPQNDAMASGVTIDPRAGKVQETLSLPEITLNDLLDREGVKKIDFLTMDIEFAEPAALRGFDIERFRPKLVCIEVFQETRELIESYFSKHGYVKLELWSRIDLYNDYFVPLDEKEKDSSRSTSQSPCTIAS